MVQPKRQTRRRIAYWTMILLTVTVAWVALPGDIGENERSLMVMLVPALVAIIMSFIGGESFNDHSERKNA